MRRSNKTLNVRSITQADVDQFRDWEQALAGTCGLRVAERLRETVSDVRQAGIEECWTQIWNKPLYANTTVAAGENYERKLAPFMAGTWRFLGISADKFLISYDGGGSKAENFSETGSLVREIRAVSGVAAKRLLAIQGGATFLRAMAASNGESAPLAALSKGRLDAIADNLHLLIPQLRQQLGRGWGHVTILHMLTDFGLAVKPDLQLARTVRHLGLVDGLREVNVPSQRESIAIVVAVLKLVQAVYGPSASSRDLRYADKLLMEVSRQGLIPHVRSQTGSRRSRDDGQGLNGSI
ncbi:MAG: hypothetical protein KGM18_00815 [Sphingomonadales bacterium]|nr:hypothetical protein [Sphingomonadales bacterium]